MNIWMKPQISQFNLTQISQRIKAKAWSVDSGMNYGGFVDSANQGDIGMIPMEGNYGHEVQAECLGWVFLGVKAFKDIYGNLHFFTIFDDGYWSRTYA